MSQTETARQDPQAAEAVARLIRRLDRLFRTPDAEDADDLAATWVREGGAALTFKGGSVWVGSQAAGVAADSLGAWPWTLAQAGVRGVQPTATLTGDGLRGLVTQLAEAEVSAARAAALRAWAWSGAAPGLRLDLGPAPWQLPARMGLGLQTRAALDQSRAAGVAHLAGRAQRGPGSSTPAQAADPAQRNAALSAARRQVEDAAAWVTATLAALEPRASAPQGDEVGAAADAEGEAAPAAADDALATSPAAEQVDADALARVVREQLGRGATLALEPVWESLADPERPVANGLRERVTAQEAGRAAGRALPLTQEGVSAVADLLDAGTPFAAGVVSGLLERAVDARTVDTLTAVLKHLGLERCWALADLSGISSLSARGLARVLKQLDAGATQWSDLIGAAPPTVAAWVLKGAPPHIVSRVGPRLRQQLLSRPPEELTPLVRALIAMNEAVPIRALGEALLETKGRGWSGRLVPEVCRALLAHGMGADVLVPLFLDRGADEQLRLLILRSLDGDRDLLEAATRFRLGEVVEPKRIQARLKAARKELKGRA